MAMTWEEAQQGALANLMTALVELSLNGATLDSNARDDLEEVIDDAKTDLNTLGGQDLDSNIDGSLETAIETRATEIGNIQAGKLKDGTAIIGGGKGGEIGGGGEGGIL